MKSSLPIPGSFADPDTPLTEFTERARRRRLEAPPRPRGKLGEPAWKTTGGDRKPGERWEVVTEGEILVFRELIPPVLSSGGFHRESAKRSRFILETNEECVVASQHAPAGSRVECYHQAAADLLASGRARVIEEQRNAF